MAAPTNRNTIQQPHAAELARQRNLRLKQMLQKLPPCCPPYFRAINDSTQELTRLGYATDLKIFFDYLITQVPQFSGLTMADFTPEKLNDITAEHIEAFLADITYYQRGDRELANHAQGKARKITAIRRLLQFWFERGVLSGNVGALIRSPKRREQAITRLDVDEVARLLDTAETGNALTRQQKHFHDITAVRDVAILTLFLGTGIRISELVGINLQDIDFNNQGIRIMRKGGKQAVVYFADEIEQALQAWLQQRKNIEPCAGHENACFLSIQRKRISPRAVENLVHKYASIVSPLKPISPHKLRSTYGTSLYRETGDIYLVAEVLGHRDVNTTRRHYAAMDEDRKRAAAKAVRLRTDPPADDTTP